MKKPNILLIMSDQHRADILGCAGDPVVMTPHIDRLASEGTRFSNVHCQGPLCMPARASFLTERYVRDHGVFQNNADVPAALPTFLQSLQAVGYHTACVGKMHLWVHEKSRSVKEHETQMQSYGFNESIETAGKLASVVVDSEYTQHLKERGLADDYRSYVAKRVYKHHNKDAEVLPNWVADPIPIPYADYSDVWHGERAARWIQQVERKDPWLLWVGFPGPHDPWDAPQEALERYAGLDIPMPGSLKRPQVPQDDSPFSRFLKYFMHVHSDTMHFTDERVAAVRRAYYANVTVIDEAVGKMRAALEDTGQLDNTWIIYTGDHGEMMGEHGMLMKMVFYDQSTKVPLIVRPPKGASASLTIAQTIDFLTEHMDLSATIRAIAGAGGHPSFEGRSLLGHLDGTQSGPARAVVFSENFGFAMVRTDQWKLVFHEDSLAPCQLFDLTADPKEDNNLLFGGSHPMAAQLLDEYARPFLAKGRVKPDGKPGPFG